MESASGTNPRGFILAKTSFALGLICAGIWLLAVAWGIIVVTTNSPLLRTFRITMGACILLSGLLNSIGLVAGIVSLLRSAPAKRKSVGGVVLNGFGFTLICVLVVFGLLDRHRSPNQSVHRPGAHRFDPGVVALSTDGCADNARFPAPVGDFHCWAVAA